jgi:Ni,Fe-hydrogenase III small subunit/ferredoxin-like protein FixX
MSHWILKGLATGIKTTRYPAREDKSPGISPGLPRGGAYPEEQARELVTRCPTEVFSQGNHQLVVDYRRCVHCFRCARETPTPIHWQSGYEWAALQAGEVELGVKVGSAFKRSIHILVVDAGDCGACLNEVKQLNNPYYNIHRLGFFITPTPREADVMLVVGPVTDQILVPLQKAYDAMPTPKRVVAVGACALSGSVFGPSFVCGAGVRDVLPVDVEVPGQPPPPLSILHGLLVAVGRKPSIAPASPMLPNALEAVNAS